MIENEIKKKLAGIFNQPKEIQLKNGWNVLDANESNCYKDGQKFISQCRHVFGYAHNVLKSIDELLSFYASEVEPNFNDNVPFCFPEYNRYFSNVLNSFYQFVEYCQKNIKWPNNTIRDCYDNNFSYRLISEIRKQDTHVFFAMSGVERKFTNEKVDNKFVIDLDDLLNNPKVKSNFKNEIKSRGNKKVYIDDLCKDFKNVFIQLICDIFCSNEIEVIKNFEALTKACKKSDGTFFNETIIFFDNMPLSLKKTITMFLLEFAGFMNYLGFYQLSKIDNENFEMLFRRINFLYYNDEISFPKVRCPF